jgi:hypothetical protein
MKTKTNINTIFSTFWISHFLIWSFGDYLSELQKIHDPAPDKLLLFVAVPLALLQIFMIIFPYFGKPKIIRTLNIFIPILFILINIGYLTEATYGWQYLIGIGYITLNLLTIRCAWLWKQSK